MSEWLPYYVKKNGDHFARKPVAKREAVFTAASIFLEAGDSQKLLSDLVSIYRMQCGIVLLALLGLAFAVRANELCSRGYLPTADEIEAGAEDPMVLQPLQSKCKDVTLVKLGCSGSTALLLIAMLVQFRYRRRFERERERLAHRKPGMQQMARIQAKPGQIDSTLGKDSED